VAAPPPPPHRTCRPDRIRPIYQDEKNLLVAHAFQQATDFHKKHPPQFA
jgi:hypothetical protein